MRSSCDYVREFSDGSMEIVGCVVDTESGLVEPDIEIVEQDFDSEYVMFRDFKFMVRNDHNGIHLVNTSAFRKAVGCPGRAP